jgi:hypothetical protein
MTMLGCVVDVGSAAYRRHQEIRWLNPHEQFTDPSLNPFQVASRSLNGADPAILLRLLGDTIEVRPGPKLVILRFSCLQESEEPLARHTTIESTLM